MRIIGQSETFCGVRLVLDRAEKRAGLPAWRAERGGESTASFYSRSAAIVAAVRRWPEVREACRRAGLSLYAEA